MPLDTKTAPSSGIDLGGIAQIAQLFTGKDSTTSTTGKTAVDSKQDTTGSTDSKGTTGTTGSTTNAGNTNTANTGTITTNEGTSPEAVAAIVKSVLEGTSGLASVASGQNKVGLYNSSTNRLLMNDLMARAAAEGAKLNKSSTQTINTGTATTTGQTQQTQQQQQTQNQQQTTQQQNTTQNQTTDQIAKTVAAPPIAPSTAAKGLAAIQLLTALGGKTNLLKSVFGTTGAAKSVAATTAADGAINNSVTGSTDGSNSGYHMGTGDDGSFSASTPTVNTQSIAAASPVNIQQQAASTPSDNLTSVQSLKPVPQSAPQIQSQGSVNIPDDVISDAASSTDSGVNLAGDINPATQSMGAGAAVDLGVPDFSAGVTSDAGVGVMSPQAGDAVSDMGDLQASPETGGGDGFDLGLGGFDMNAPVDATDLGFDFEGFSDAFGDWDLGFAEGGMVDKTKAVLRANPQAEAAFQSGGDEKESKKVAAKETAKDERDERDQPAVKNGNIGARILRYIKGYAAGGRTEDYYSNNRMVMSYAEGGRVSAPGPKNDEINPDAVAESVAGYSRDGRSNYVSNAIHEEDRARRDYNNNSTGNVDSQRRRAILADRYDATRRALMQPEAGAGRGNAKGYASGGKVTDLTNLGLRIRRPDDAAPLQASSATGGDPSSPFANKQAAAAAAAAQQTVAPVPVRRIEGSDQGTGSVNTAKLNTNSGSGTPVSMTRTEPSAPAAPSSVGGTSSTNAPTAVRPRIPVIRPAPSGTQPQNTASGDATDTPSVVGSVSENAAAIGGMGIAAATAALGPVAGLAVTLGMDALGISHSSMNPISNTLSFIQNAVVSAFSGDTGVSQSADAVGGMSSPSVSVGGVTTTGASTSQEAQDAAASPSIASITGEAPSPSDADSGIGTGIGVNVSPDADSVGGQSTGSSSNSSVSVSGENEGAGSASSGIGSSSTSGNDGFGGFGAEGSGGSSSGGIGGVGGGTGPASSSAGDADGPSYSSGGDVSGPGSETADLIPAWLSDKEFVLNATAVEAIDKAMGPDWLDQINDHFKPSQKELAQGKKIHNDTVGQSLQDKMSAQKPGLMRAYADEANQNKTDGASKGNDADLAGAELRRRILVNQKKKAGVL